MCFARQQWLRSPSFQLYVLEGPFFVTNLWNIAKN